MTVTIRPGSRIFPPLRRLWLLICVSGVLAGWGPIQQEEELRAALVLGFARFTEWPLFQDGPLVIGVLEHPAMAAAIGRVAEGKAVNGRPIAVRLLRIGGDAQDCHIVYLARLSGKRLQRAMREITGSGRKFPVLTIGEDGRFLDAGGAVHLFEEDGRMGFEVSLPALRASRLAISSKLLRLGYAIRGERQTEGGQ
jgi:hypothetical protein